MSTQKSRSKNKTIPKYKSSDYLKKYVGNTPENVRRMREIFKTDGEIYRKFPYLTRGDDRDFHVFYEYIENKHLLDEKEVFPFENTRDYAFLYWFLDEIHPQNWDKLGAGEERERRKFKDGYYLNMSEIIDDADNKKFNSLVYSTISSGLRGIIPKPPLGEKYKNDAVKWRNWKIAYAKRKKQEYKLHPELSELRNERSAPKELDDSDDDDDYLCNIPSIKPEDRVRGNDPNYYRGANVEEQTAGLNIFQKKIEYYEELIKKFEGNGNNECKNKAIKRMKQYIELNSDLEIISKDRLNGVSRGRSPSPASLEDEITFEDIVANFQEYRGRFFSLNRTQKLGVLTNITGNSDTKFLNFEMPNGTYGQTHDANDKKFVECSVYKKNREGGERLIVHYIEKGREVKSYTYGLRSRFYIDSVPESTSTGEGSSFDELFRKNCHEIDSVFNSYKLKEKNGTQEIDLGELTTCSNLRPREEYENRDTLVFKLGEGPISMVFKDGSMLKIRFRDENSGKFDKGGGFNLDVNSRFIKYDTPNTSPTLSAGLAEKIERGGKSRKTKRNNKKQSVSRKRIKNRR